MALVVVAGQAGSLTTNNVTLPGTGSQSATDLLSDRFPSQAYGTNPLVVATDSGKLTDSKYSKAIGSSVSALKKTPHVTAAVSPLSDAGSGALSKDKQIGYISVALDVGQGSITVDEAQAVLDAANPAKKAGLQVAIGGYVGQELSKPDTGASDKIGILAAMLILLLVFGSAVAMGLPIVTAVLGLLCGLSVVTLLSHIADIPTTAPTLATMIGLAVGIDYSLFIVTKHRTQVSEGMEVRESIARASATAGGAVLFAGGTVAISLLALVVADIPLVTTLGYTSAIAVAFAILAALTLLPALFGLVGSHVSALTLPFRKVRAAEKQSPLWTRLATGISQSPLAGDDRGAGGPGGAFDPHAVAASGAGGRRRGADRHDRTPGLRPDHRGLRGGDERAVPDLRPAQPAREAGSEEPQQDQVRTRSSCSSSSSRSSSKHWPRARRSSRRRPRRSSRRRSSPTSSPTRRSRPSSRQPTRASRPCEQTSRRPRASSR